MYFACVQKYSSSFNCFFNRLKMDKTPSAGMLYESRPQAGFAHLCSRMAGFYFLFLSGFNQFSSIGSNLGAQWAQCEGSLQACLRATEHLFFPFPTFPVCSLTRLLRLGLEKAAPLFLSGSPEVALSLPIVLLQTVLF